MILSVVGNVNVGTDATPPRHTASATVGATGVTTAHDAAGKITVNVAFEAAFDRRHHPSGN